MKDGGYKGNPEQDRQSLLEVGIPDAIITIDNDPTGTFQVLQDTLKNSVGGTIDMMYRHVRR